MEVMNILKLVAVFGSLAFAIGATYWMAYDFGRHTQKKEMWRDMEDFPEKYIEDIKKRAEIRKQNNMFFARLERERELEKISRKRKIQKTINKIGCAFKKKERN